MDATGSSKTQLPTGGVSVGSGQIMVVVRESKDPWLPVTVLAVAGTFTAIGLALFGLPGVDLHSPLHFLGIMDPLCGGTRAIRLATQGQWARSWEYNPVGIPVLALFGILDVRAGVGLSTHRWYTMRFNWSGRSGRIAFLILFDATVALEVRQQSIATLLMGRT